tara:strand:+ start:99 stop:944 length:846 start_codon:yes stop_codon:yes gene_type:complete
MNICILGGGYIGTHLSNSLLGYHNVTVLRRAELDYNKQYKLLAFLSNNKIDYVINCSGFIGRPNVDQAEDKKKECWDLNVSGPVNVNRVCKALQIPYVHITTGCIYTGYEKAWSEEDEVNYGLFNVESSFYSKSKHAYELAAGDYGLTLRIRMPFSNDITSERSVLYKLRNYNNLINFKNSKTYIPDLCRFVKEYIAEGRNENDVLNLVNPDALDTAGVIEFMKAADKGNPNWKFVDFAALNTKCNRSNCTLDITKLKEKYNFEPMTESDALALVYEKSSV